jgi:hypothetical protein
LLRPVCRCIGVGDVKPLIAGILLLAGAVSLCGCAAKNVIPVQMTQPGDETLDCAALGRQTADNEAAAAIFLRKDKQVEQANAAKGVGSAIPGLGLLLVLSTDLSNEEQIKARALIDRDERLRFLSKQKGCMP